MADKIEIRECTTLPEMAACVELQREVFALPDVELSPVRHLVVTKNAGGFALGAYDDGKLVGFVLSVPAFLRGERAFYSHMTAVAASHQGRGVGAMLKWAQRDEALRLGVKYVKWTFEPGKARNAYFNLEKLGAVINEYRRNFYGTDYPDGSAGTGVDSDRLFAEWHLESDRVAALAERRELEAAEPHDIAIGVTSDWLGLVKTDPAEASREIDRMRSEFESAFAGGAICRRFDRGRSEYLLYNS